MKFLDIKNKSLQDLESMVKSMRAELGKSSFDLANNSLKDTSKINKLKKDIARVLTAKRNLNHGK